MLLLPLPLMSFITPHAAFATLRLPLMPHLFDIYAAAASPPLLFDAAAITPLMLMPCRHYAACAAITTPLIRAAFRC